MIYAYFGIFNRCHAVTWRLRRAVSTTRGGTLALTSAGIGSSQHKVIRQKLLPRLGLGLGDCPIH